MRDDGGDEDAVDVDIYDAVLYYTISPPTPCFVTA